MSGSRQIAPFGRRELEVVESRSFGQYKVIGVIDSEAPVALAGQFHMLAARNSWGGEEDGRPWLPRPISFLSNGDGGRFDFLIDPIGPGTRLLAELEVGEFVGVVGPLGNGFSTAAEGVRPVLVGGGIGAAPVMALSELLVAEGRDHDLILGFRSEHQAQVAQLASHAKVMTDDGSAGERGNVIDALDQLEVGSATFFGCGPAPMLNALRLRAERIGVRSQLALESPMACGFGACFGCAVETRTGIIRLCVDGPVLEGEMLEFITPTGRRPAA